MRRLLVVTHRPVEGAGGAVARWRSLAARLPEHGWHVDVVSAGEVPVEFEADPNERARSAPARLKSLAAPALALAGLRPAAVTPSTAWALRGAREVRRRVRTVNYDAVLGTGPPVAGPLAAWLGTRGTSTPLAIELRDLWAANPAYEVRPGALNRVERRLIAAAALVVAVTPQAAASLERRHGVRAAVVPNGFEPELLDLREERDPSQPRVLVHSGTVVPGRPVRPLAEAIARRPAADVRLVLHGYVAPECAQDAAGAEIVPPSGWRDAVERMRDADACVVLQSAAVGDETAVAGKVYEYLALGKPVLCLSDGGATESLLRELGADDLAVRLGDRDALDAALGRIARGDLPPMVDRERLAPYSRLVAARQLAELLEMVASTAGPRRRE